MFEGKYIRFCKSDFRDVLIRKPNTSWCRYNFTNDPNPIDTINHLMRKSWVKEESILRSILNFYIDFHPNNEVLRYCLELKRNINIDSLNIHERNSNMFHYGKSRISTIKEGVDSKIPIFKGYKNWDREHYKIIVDYGLKYSLFIDNKNIWIISKNDAKQKCELYGFTELNNKDKIAKHVKKELDIYIKFINKKIETF